MTDIFCFVNKLTPQCIANQGHDVKASFDLMKLGQSILQTLGGGSFLCDVLKKFSLLPDKKSTACFLLLFVFFVFESQNNY